MKQKVHLLIILSLSPLTFLISCGQQGDSKPYPLVIAWLEGVTLAIWENPFPMSTRVKNSNSAANPAFQNLRKILKNIFRN